MISVPELQHSLIDRRLRHLPDQLMIILKRHKLLLLPSARCIFRALLHLREPKRLFRQQAINRPRILRLNMVALRQVADLDDLEIHQLQHIRCIRVQIRTRFIVHDAGVEFARLIVFPGRAFRGVVALAGNNVVGDGVGRFGAVGTELVDEAVGDVVWVTAGVGVGAEGAIEVDAGVGFCHERTIDWTRFVSRGVCVVEVKPFSSYQALGVDSRRDGGIARHGKRRS